MAGLAATNELDVAREALRDGLWNVARTHAARAAGDEARLVVLESYAQEGNWRGLLAAIDAMGYPSGEGFAYYRAAALFNEGSVAAASNMLAGVRFKEAGLARSAARLRAELALARRDFAAARTILEKDGGDDAATLLMRASIESETGKDDAARALWNRVVADTNATERARATAAAELRDAKRLRELSSAAKSGTVRRFANLRLGTLLIASEATFKEGERIIRETVRDRPDAAGAREAHLALAEACLARQAYAEADRLFAEAPGIWPDMAKDALLHEGRGWALEKLKRFDEALEEFRLAEELTTDPDRKATAAVKAADVLAAAGRDAEATAAYQKVLEKYPGTDASARVARIVHLRETEEKGRALYRAFKFEEARQLFASLKKEDPSRHDRMALYEVLCAYGAGDDETAERTARALADGAKDASVRADATHWLAKFVFNRARWREAECLFNAYAAARPEAPDAPQALVWSARAALADNDFQNVITTVATLLSRYPESPARASGMLAQGEALIELARFDEAVLVLDRATVVKGASDSDRLRARIMRADALFAMGADNPARYQAALSAYQAIQTGETLSADAELTVSFKTAKTLEKLKRFDEAIDMYYTQVVLAYRTGRLAGTHYDDESRATFARAAFRLADEYVDRGRARQAVHVLELVRASDVPAADEAARRIDRLTQKGMFQ